MNKVQPYRDYVEILKEWDDGTNVSSTPTEENIIIGPDWTIDRSTKTIEYTGSDSTISVLDLHRWLQSLYDDPDMMEHGTPSVRHTDNFIELRDGLKVSDASIPRLTAGALKQGDEYFSSGPIQIGSIKGHG